MSRQRRVYHPGLAAEASEIVNLTTEESHHVRRVLRLRVGDPLLVFDGAGSEWNGTVESLEPSGVQVRIGEHNSPCVESAIDIRLYQGLCRYDRIEWVIQKSTELGVRSIHVVVMARSEVAPPPENRLGRWRRLAIEACKQSGRTRVPEVTVLDGVPSDPGAGTVSLVLDADPGAPALAAVFARSAPPEVRLAVGPEGGFTPEELDLWTLAGWQSVGLGPRTLRTETAGIVAVALTAHAWGDLGAC